MYVEEQRSCCSLHRLNLYFGLWTHRRIGLLERIEVQNGSKDLTGNGLATSKERAKAIEGRVDQDSITANIASGTMFYDYTMGYIPNALLKDIKQAV